jgi:hypothetical protein
LIGAFQASHSSTADALFAVFHTKLAPALCRLLHSAASHLARVVLAAIDSRVGLPLDNADARLLIPSTKTAFKAVSDVFFLSETQFTDKFGENANADASDTEDGRIGQVSDVLQDSTLDW